MPIDYEEIERMALQLDEFGRERLLDALSESLAGEREPLAPEWARELERRIEEWESGDRTTIEAGPLLENLRRRIR